MIAFFIFMFWAVGASMFSAFTYLFGTIAIILGSMLLWDYYLYRTKRRKKDDTN